MKEVRGIPNFDNIKRYESQSLQNLYDHEIQFL